MKAILLIRKFKNQRRWKLDANSFAKEKKKLKLSSF